MWKSRDSDSEWVNECDLSSLRLRGTCHDDLTSTAIMMHIMTRLRVILWLMFMPLPAISRGKHAVFRLSERNSLCVCLLTRCLINRLWAFTKVTTHVHLETKMNWFDFEIKRSKVKVTTRPKIVKSHLFKDASSRRRYAAVDGSPSIIYNYFVTG